MFTVASIFVRILRNCSGEGQGAGSPAADDSRAVGPAILKVVLAELSSRRPLERVGPLAASCPQLLFWHTLLTLSLEVHIASFIVLSKHTSIGLTKQWPVCSFV